MKLRFWTVSQVQRFAELMSGELATQDLAALLSPHSHTGLFKLRRAQIIIRRVRLMAVLFAILTPLWIIVDFLFLPSSLWASLALIRMVTSMAFAMTALYWRPNNSMWNAYRALAMLFVIPGVFYFITQDVLAHYHLQGISEAIKTGYAYLPFVLLAGISIFPLALAESLFIALPLLITQAFSGLFSGPMLGWPSFAGAFWLQTLIAGVSGLACMSQLSFMIALFIQAINDPLTGVHSRRSGEELLNLQFQIAIRSQANLSVAFIDLDHFKEINDNHGHDVGDRILVTATAAMIKKMRLSDILVRWGGEEFLLIMPDTDLAEARQAMTRLQEFGFGELAMNFRLTASIGLAELRQDGSATCQALVEAADRRMYLAKQRGRNQTIYADNS